MAEIWGSRSCNADFFDAWEAPEPAAPSWRELLLERSDERDRRMEGVRDLYEQYASCRDSLRAVREQSGPAGAGGTSASSAEPPQVGAEHGTSEDFEPAAAAAAGTQEGEASRQPVASGGEWVRCQELQALQQLLKEREEELSERDVVFAELQYKNAQLKAELKRAQDRLQEATVSGPGTSTPGSGVAAKQR